MKRRRVIRATNYIGRPILVSLSLGRRQVGDHDFRRRRTQQLRWQNGVCLQDARPVAPRQRLELDRADNLGQQRRHFAKRPTAQELRRRHAEIEKDRVVSGARKNRS